MTISRFALIGIAEKQPIEQFGLGVEYAGGLPDGSALSSAVISAIDQSDGSDQDAVVLVSTTGVVSGTQVTFRVKGGVDGHTYTISITAILSTGPGDTLQSEIYLKVSEV